MAADLLSTIRHEIDERIRELRPLLDEYEQLRTVFDVLVTEDREDPPTTAAQAIAPTSSSRRKSRVAPIRRGSAAGAIERAASCKYDQTSRLDYEIVAVTTADLAH